MANRGAPRAGSPDRRGVGRVIGPSWHHGGYGGCRGQRRRDARTHAQDLGPRTYHGPPGGCRQRTRHRPGRLDSRQARRSRSGPIDVTPDAYQGSDRRQTPACGDPAPSPDPPESVQVPGTGASGARLLSARVTGQRVHLERLTGLALTLHGRLPGRDPPRASGAENQLGPDTRWRGPRPRRWVGYRGEGLAGHADDRNLAKDRRRAGRHRPSSAGVPLASSPGPWPRGVQSETSESVDPSGGPQCAPAASGVASRLGRRPEYEPTLAPGDPQARPYDRRQSRPPVIRSTSARGRRRDRLGIVGSTATPSFRGHLAIDSHPQG